jgi:hypothetical protein
MLVSEQVAVLKKTNVRPSNNQFFSAEISINCCSSWDQGKLRQVIFCLVYLQSFKQNRLNGKLKKNIKINSTIKYKMPRLYTKLFMGILCQIPRLNS